MKARALYYQDRRDRAEYAEACARVRALEKKLLNWGRLGELAAAPGQEAATLFLRRWGWIGGVREREGEWDQTLTMALRETDRALVGMDPRPEVTLLLVAKHDLLNLCAVLKARALSRPFDGPLHRRGTSSLPALEVMANKLDFSTYPAPLAEELTCLRDILIRGECRELAEAVARARHLSLRKAARREGSRLFEDYLDHLADLHNISTALRALSFPGLWSTRMPLFPSGNIDQDLLLREQKREDLLRSLSKTVYGPMLERCRTGGDALSFGRLEREADDFLSRLLDPARYIALGPEPIWSYWLAREADARNIRAVMFGLRAKTPWDSLRQKLRRPYV